ncbi:MAG: nucleotidyltransferase domain-containing protein [Bacteroidaceae bacterium]|nr:nucleotidyltransferase domain-containing protein [Bacteroidaceae bacterium]MBR1801477.1 nucleotidyltransferase domain-containing protein [Bacteroidaceae bacterium]
MKNNLLEHSHARIATLCRKHKVRRLYAFGSVLTPRFTEESDVDFLVDFKTDEIYDYLTNYFELKYALEDALGREVDLVEEKAVRNPIFKRNIERTKSAIYG